MVREYSPVLIKIYLKTGFIGESDRSSFAVFSDASQAGSSTDVDATQAGSLANLCAGDATKIREVLYSLFVGGRSMFRLDPYIVVQIAAFHGCEHPASLNDHTDSRSRLLFHFLSGNCVHHRCSSSGTQGCPTFAVGFSSETDMVGYVVDVLLNADGRLLSTENLLSCARLFGLVQDPSLTRARNICMTNFCSIELIWSSALVHCLRSMYYAMTGLSQRLGLSLSTLSISQTAFSHVR